MKPETRGPALTIAYLMLATCMAICMAAAFAQKLPQLMTQKPTVVRDCVWWQPGVNCWDTYTLCEKFRDHHPFAPNMTGPGGRMELVLVTAGGKTRKARLERVFTSAWEIDRDLDGDVDLRDYAIMHGPLPDCESTLNAANAEIARLRAELKRQREAFVKALGKRLGD